MATISALQTEATGNLTQRIEVLSLLRMGEVPTAIVRLESEADQLTRTIALNPAANQLVLFSRSRAGAFDRVGGSARPRRLADRGSDGRLIL